MVVIRVATPDDALAIAKVQIETWRTAYRTLLPADYLAVLSIERRSISQRIHLERLGDDTSVVVAVVDQRVIGYVSCGASRGDDDAAVGEIYAIYVLESFAGQGVGTALIRQAERWLRERGFSRAMLWVLDGNEPARHFYRRNGWFDSGEMTTIDLDGLTVREHQHVRELEDSEASSACP